MNTTVVPPPPTLSSGALTAECPDVDALMEAMQHDGVLPETVVILGWIARRRLLRCVPATAGAARSLRFGGQLV